MTTQMILAASNQIGLEGSQLSALPGGKQRLRVGELSPSLEEV